MHKSIQSENRIKRMRFLFCREGGEDYKIKGCGRTGILARFLNIRFMTLRKDT